MGQPRLCWAGSGLCGTLPSKCPGAQSIFLQFELGGLHLHANRHRLGTLAISFVVPDGKLSLVAGLMQAFQDFFTRLGLGIWATKVMAALVGLGTLALISTWMIGPSEGVYAAEGSGELPPELHYVNKRHVPVAMLLAQGGLGTLFALLYLFVPGVSTGYWMLTALTIQLTVLMYIMMFAAAIRLRYSEPGTSRPYRIPGGKYLGMWLVGGMGVLRSEEPT